MNEGNKTPHPVISIPGTKAWEEETSDRVPERRMQWMTETGRRRILPVNLVPPYMGRWGSTVELGSVLVDDHGWRFVVIGFESPGIGGALVAPARSVPDDEDVPVLRLSEAGLFHFSHGALADRVLARLFYICALRKAQRLRRGLAWFEKRHQHGRPPSNEEPGVPGTWLVGALEDVMQGKGIRESQSKLLQAASTWLRAEEAAEDAA